MKRNIIRNQNRDDIKIKKTKSFKHKKLKTTLIVFFAMVYRVGSYALTVNFYVILSQNERIVDESVAGEIDDVDCVLVLGCGIWGDTPSPMLEDRLNAGVAVFNDLSETELLLSGDNSGEQYNEVGVMKKYSVSMGVDEKSILLDDYGFSTYESIFNAKNTFDADKIIIVTQKYHLYRALYIAEKMGIEAYGVAANPRQYRGQIYRSLREVAARNKDFLKCIM